MAGSSDHLSLSGAPGFVLGKVPARSAYHARPVGRAQHSSLLAVGFVLFLASRLDSQPGFWFGCVCRRPE
jgi:hypothetical protein